MFCKLYDIVSAQSTADAQFLLAHTMSPLPFQKLKDCFQMYQLVILLGQRWSNESFEDETKFKFVITVQVSQNYVTNYVVTN